LLENRAKAQHIQAPHEVKGSSSLDLGLAQNTYILLICRQTLAEFSDLLTK
jgi:hypothetical protein